MNAKKLISLLAVCTLLTAFLGACAPNNGTTVPSSSAGTSGGASTAPSSGASTGGGTSAAGTVEPVKIAALFNTTGPNADVGLIDLSGVQMAVNRKNREGGIQSLGGAPIELIIGDTMSDTSQGKAIAERVLSDDKIVGVLAASGSAYVIPMLPVFDKLKIPCISHNVGMAVISQGYQYIFMAAPHADKNSEVQLEFFEWFNKELYDGTLNKVGIIYENSDYGASVAKSSADLAQTVGYNVVYNQSFPINMSDASSMVVSLKQSGAQVVFPTAFQQDAKLILNTMKSINYAPAVIGGGGGFLMAEFAEALGEDIGGFLSAGSSTSWDIQSTMDNQELQSVVQEYRDTYGVFPTEHFLTSYSNAMIMIAALEKSGTSNREDLRNAIKNTHIETFYTGGPCDFNDVGWNQVTYPVVIQWQKQQNGAFEPRTIYPEKDATSKYIRPEELLK